MNHSEDKPVTDRSNLILAGVVELRRELDAFRTETRVDLAELIATLDRIETHLSDISTALRKTPHPRANGA